MHCINQTFDFDIEKIHEELYKLAGESNKLTELIYGIIIEQELLNKSNYKHQYISLSTINYLYDFDKNNISTKTINEPNLPPSVTITEKGITKEFYEGFGINLLQD